MIISTTPTIEGHKIIEYKGIVTGETIIGANFIKDFLAGIRDIVGGRSQSYEGFERGKRHVNPRDDGTGTGSWRQRYCGNRH